MKYCFRFFSSNRHLNDVDEVIIKCDDETKVSSLLVFTEKHKKQRVIAEISSMELLNKLLSGIQAAVSAYPTFTIIIPFDLSSDAVPILKENNIPFFFSNYCSSWDLLNAAISAGATDVRVVSELGFSLPKVKEICQARNVKIRCFPNVCQSTAIPSFEVDTFKTFWINPVDMYIYENFIDVIEFYSNALDRQDVLYEIYKEKKWPNDLRLVILGSNFAVQADAIPPLFASSRLGCGKRCNYEKCTHCDTMLEVAKSLKDKGFSFVQEEEKNEQ